MNLNNSNSSESRNLQEKSNDSRRFIFVGTSGQISEYNLTNNGLRVRNQTFFFFNEQLILFF